MAPFMQSIIWAMILCSGVRDRVSEPRPLKLSCLMR